MPGSPNGPTISLGPSCPNCGKKNSKVVCTKEIIGRRFDIIRRRYCKSCLHRWYTGQLLEQNIDPEKNRIEWIDHGAIVLDVVETRRAS